MKQLGLGAMLYSDDADDHLPGAALWMDQVRPYLRNYPAAFRSPALSTPGEFGFAFHRSLTAKEMAKIENPAVTFLIFDSTDTSWNANGGLDLMPNPGRYKNGNSAPLNAVAFADGHAKSIAPARRA